jgi:lipid II:glycine glycyltransferase (peptidoglycan interpeptide bridge formation enzyme)
MTTSPETWTEFLSHHPDAHLLQSAPWGQLKSEFGWHAEHVIVGDSGAQVLFRKLPLGFSFAYIPKGPLGPHPASLWPRIDALCEANRAVFLKVEPDAFAGQAHDSSAFAVPLFQPSAHFIQPPRTITIDISRSADDIQAAMKSKTRYNIRLAEKKDVIVKPSADVRIFSEMMEITGERDEFGVHSLAYYQRAYDLFHPLGMCELLIAEYNGIPLAGLIVFAAASRAWYLYGASTNHERNRMPTYALQWAAIQWAKARGCTQYDLWGAPDHDEHTLEAQFAGRGDGLWGVYRFKRGFGGQLNRAIGAWDRVYMPALYRIYRWRYRN